MLFDRANLDQQERDALEHAVSPLRLLEDVVRWGSSSTPRRPVVDVVIQDELTHDVVLPYRDALHLVFGTT